MSIYSEKLTFKIDCSCEIFRPVRFTWLNRLGGFDSFTFRLKSTRTVDIQRKEFKKYLSYLTPDLSWNYQIGDRGRTVYDIQSIDIHTVVSTFHDEETHRWLEELFTSPEVYRVTPDAFGNPQYDPIIITKNSVVIDTKRKPGNKLLSHDIEYVMAYKKVIQRG